MKREEITYEDFKLAYQNEISNIAKSQEVILRNLRDNAKVSYSIKESGTSISLQIKSKLVTEINLILGFQEIYNMYLFHKDLSFKEILNKIIAHEFLHVLYNDFSHEKLLEAHEQYYKQKVGREVTTLELKNSFSSEFDYKVYNIAADFIINQNLGIYYPAMRPEYFSLPTDLSVFEYYKFLKFMKDGLNSPNETKDISDEGEIGEEVENNLFDELDNGIGNYEEKIDLASQLIENNDFAKEALNQNKDKNLSSDLVDDLIKNENNDEFGDLYNNNYGDPYGAHLNAKAKGEGKGNHSKKELSAKQKVFNKESKRIIKILEKEEGKDKAFKFQGKQDDWGRFNNRKYAVSDLMYPGKEKATGFIEQKIANCGVLFVDVSGSMSGIIDQMYNLLATILSKTSVTLVFYDDGITSVHSSASGFNKKDIQAPDASGGTSFENAFNEYCRKYNFDKSKQHVYVFTDGYDDFNDIPDITWILSNIGNYLSIQERRKDIY